jgi:hypothetical protein
MRLTPVWADVSGGRVEGLFGVTAGVTIDRVRPFARFRPGFLAVRESPAPFACILIYPSPLECVLASGRTLLAVDVGGGVDVALSSRTLMRWTWAIASFGTRARS